MDILWEILGNGCRKSLSMIQLWIVLSLVSLPLSPHALECAPSFLGTAVLA